MKYTHSHAGFTLVEIIVASTVFSLLMVSVLSIFMLSSNLSHRLELSRQIQSNVKIMTEDIAESVRKNDLHRAYSDISVLGGCKWNENPNDKTQGHILCIQDEEGNRIRYFLGQANESVLGEEDESVDWKPVSDVNNCKLADKEGEVCRVIKHYKNDDIKVPLTSNLVNVESLNFQVSRSPKRVPFVQMNMTIRSAYGVSVQSKLIDSTRLEVQSSFSERTIITK